MVDQRVANAIDLVKRAGELIIKRKKVLHLQVKNQDPSDLVSNVDLEVEKFLISELASMYPDACFFTEEMTSEFIEKAECFIIDPIDGTTNFVSQGENYAISLAYYYRREAVFGIVYDVMRGDLFLGVKGQGASLNGEQLCSKQDNGLDKMVIDCSLKSMMQLKEFHDVDVTVLVDKVRGHRALGCASLAICWIAAGKLNAYLSSKLKLWDYAAANIVLCEAMGVWVLPFHEQGAFHRDSVVAVAVDNAKNTEMLLEILLNFFH